MNLPVISNFITVRKYIYIDLILTRRKIKNIDCFAIFNNPFCNRFTEIQFCKRNVFVIVQYLSWKTSVWNADLVHFKQILRWNIRQVKLINYVSCWNLSWPVLRFFLNMSFLEINLKCESVLKEYRTILQKRWLFWTRKKNRCFG
jgi:hypothetical protein